MVQILYRSFAFVLAVTVALILTPIEFDSEGVGSGSLGNDSFCSIAAYSSTYWKQVVSWSCTFNRAKDAADRFSKLTDDADVILVTSNHVVASYGAPAGGYCSSWLEENHLLISCSTSLEHVVKFDRQKIGKP